MEAYSVVWSYGGAASLMLASLLLVLLVHPRWERRGLCVTFLVVVGALHAVSLANAFGGPIPGAQWDAWTFHRQATQLAEAGSWPALSIGTKPYEYILTAGYRLFGPHILVGQSLSVLVATLSLITISAVAVNLGVADNRVRAGMILAAGLFPTFVYHNALTFREAYELLGLVLGVFCALKAFEDHHRPIWITGAVLSLLFMGLFHHVLLGISVILICIFVLLLYAPGLKTRRSFVVMTALIAMIGGLGYVAITNIPITLENDYIKKIRQEQGIVEAIVKYRNAIESRQPRTSFDLNIDTSSRSELAKGAVYNYWNYLARPFVSDVESTADLVPFAGSVARIVLLAFLAWLVLSRRLVDRRTAFCVAAYLVVTMVWSLGTTNYGQAFRHHALTDWLLVLLAGYALVHQRWQRPAVP